jgi:transposase
MVGRSRVILLAAEGRTGREIVRRQKMRLTRVSKWRQRFCQDRVAGLEDAARPGKPKSDDEKTGKRILALLDTDPSEGHSQWNGHLVAQNFRNVSDDRVWRVFAQT